MSRLSPLLLSLLGASSVLGLPATTNTSPNRNHPLHKRCGPVGEFYKSGHPTAQDWTSAATDDWLSNWRTYNAAAVAAEPEGFSAAFGKWALGSPGWNCRDDGDTTSCGIETVCDNRVLADKGADARQAFYVLKSLTELHTFFTGTREAFETSAIVAALAKDSWVRDFYRDKDTANLAATFWKELTADLALGMGIAGMFLGPLGGVASNLVGFIAGAVSRYVSSHADDTVQKEADVGRILAAVVLDSVKGFTSSNNDLMHGDSIPSPDGSSSDISTVLRGGAFVDFQGGVDKNAIVDKMNAYLSKKAINYVWHQQKVFIMGGLPCDDNGNGGSGQGPSNAMYCDQDGKAWYLFFWQEAGHIALNSHQWGWVNPPVGLDKLGAEGYQGISIEDAIKESVGHFARAGAAGPATTAFDIPVCDVSATLTDDYKANWFEGRQYILQPYGHEMRPMWCGPICAGSKSVTEQWISDAKMYGFRSPRRLCSEKFWTKYNALEH